MTPIDWDDLRIFLAVVRCGNVSDAAAQLRVTHGTVRRRLASLDGALGVGLLQLAGRTYAPTAAGNAILVHVECVQNEMTALLLSAQGSDGRPEGRVRVAVPDFVATRLLLPAFAALSQRQPKIYIELLDADEGQPISPGDYDIAIQQRRFEQPSLITRLLGRIGFGLYGSTTYIDAHGSPNFEEACEGHRLIEGIDSMVSPVDVTWLQNMTGRARVVLKVASFETFLSAITNGYGIGVLPRFVAERLLEPPLVRLAPSVPVPPVELWLGVHRETRALARTRHVMDAAAAAVKAQQQLLNSSDMRTITASASHHENLQVSQIAA